MTTSTAPALKLTVSTVPAVLVQTGFIQVTASTRGSTGKDGVKKEIAADQRSRSIIIPEYTPNVSSKYVRFVCDALEKAAQSQLAEQWKENPQLREVDAALYSEDSILAFWARAAESKKLTKETITAWFQQSELRKELAAKYTDKQVAKFLADLENVSAPVPSSDTWNEDKALKRIVLLGKNETDAEHDVCKAIIAKLTRYVERIQKARAEIGDVAEIDE